MTDQMHLLKKVTDLLKDNNIEYFLDCGTLLGAVREGDFLAHDANDIDIGLKQEDYWKVRTIIDRHFELEYKNYWRAEIAVTLDNKCHLDMFFYTDEGKYLATQACLGNPMQRGINIESETRRLKENIFPLKTIKMKRKTFFVPNNPEAVLEEQYGKEWRTPVTKWYHEYGQGLNPEHRTIGILITAFLRDDKLFKEVNSILQYCDKDDLFRKWIRIYIADQGNPEWSEEKQRFYDQLRANGHKIFKTPYNSGLSYNRNFLVEQSNEPYLMIIDDDFEFTEKTDLTQMIEILNHREKNGIVGGDIDERPPYHANLMFEVKGGINHLYRIQKMNQEQNVKNYKYYYTDIVLNFFLAKRKVLEDVKLDNNLKLVEHSDHMLRIKRDSDWKVCYCPDVTCRHQRGRDSDEYRNFRHNHNYVQMFLDKWNIKEERNAHKVYVTPIKEIKCIEEKPEHKEKIKVVQIARIPCANSAYEVSNLLNKYSDKYESRYILGAEYSRNNQTIPFRQFPYDILWKENQEEAIRLIKEADIIHIHHDSWEDIEQYFEGKCVVSTLYNLTQSLQYKDNKFNNDYLNKLKSFGHITVADQPLQKIMFSDISTDTVPLVKMMFGLRVYDNGNKNVVIGFAPTNKSPIGIGSKRFEEVMTVINGLKEKYDFEFKLIEGLPYEENLVEKGKCDIIIDDIDDRYEKAHNTTIEAGMLNAVP